MSTRNEVEEAIRAEFDGLAMHEVRRRAAQKYGVTASREHTKDQILDQVISAASKHNFAELAEGELKPGFARIQLHPVPGKPTFPVFVGINGRSFWVPFSVPVDVPRKLVGVLRDAIERKHAGQELINNVPHHKWQEEQSYPFTLIQDRPGPDPFPGFEVKREQKLKAKREFLEEHGYWPSDAIMAEARSHKALSAVINKKD